MNKKLFTIFLILLISFDTIPCKNLVSMADATIATIKSDNEAALLNAVTTLNKNGGVIYINTSIINISSLNTIVLSGTKSGGIVGMKQANGSYPRISFKNARNKGSTARGFTITGSNQYMKFLTIEHAGDNGIWINGSKNTLDHIIARYNNDTGIQLSNNANSNTLNYCYSYRNIDVSTYGGNADGFAPKLGVNNIVFNYCFAWDNSDDGWDSFDHPGDVSASIQYLHSACWNNGNPDVFTGKYDYDLGRSLDKNMWTVQQLMASDSTFESNYNNKKFSITKGKIAGMAASTWLAKAQTEMNGNGFKFGSANTPQNTSIYRKAVYSVAFDHKQQGFNNNNSKSIKGYFANCVSFNNNINYQLPYVFEKWASNWSWNAIKADQFGQNQGLHTPKDKNAATKQFYAIRNKIITNCAASKFDDSVNFDNVIKSLV